MCPRGMLLPSQMLCSTAILPPASRKVGRASPTGWRLVLRFDPLPCAESQDECSSRCAAEWIAWIGHCCVRTRMIACMPCERDRAQGLACAPAANLKAYGLRPGLLDGQPSLFLAKSEDIGDSPGAGVGEGPPAALGTTGTPMTRTCPMTRPITTARTADWLCIFWRCNLSRARLIDGRKSKK